jgi:hypothetical protein
VITATAVNLSSGAKKIYLDQNTIFKGFLSDVTIRTLLTIEAECVIMPISQKKEFGTDTKS